MARIPENNVFYCAGTSGVVVEWQNPDRDLLIDPWTSNLFNTVPIRVNANQSLGTLIETINLAPGGNVTTADPLVKNKFYSFVATGVLTVGVGKIADACFFVDSGAGIIEPSDRLTLDDDLFASAFFLAAEIGDVIYDPILHEYSVGFIGNDAPVTFSLATGGTGTLQIDIYENIYDVAIADIESNILYAETRDKPFLNLNIACGGECPTRTSFPCECNGKRSCYWDDKAGAITKIFEGTANP